MLVHAHRKTTLCMANDVIFGYAPEYVQMAQLTAYLKYLY